MTKLKPEDRADYCPPDAPYYNDKIIGVFSGRGIGKKPLVKHFKGMWDAVAWTRIRPGYIRRCIDEGMRWGCWTFDLE